MTALTAPRATAHRVNHVFADPVAASTRIWAGSIVVLNSSGNAVPASTATGLVVRGRARATVDNRDGIAGDLSVESETGTFRWANSASADAITRAEIGDTCYLVDDQTVAKTSASSTRSAAGVVVDVDDQGVWVKFS